MAEICIKIPEDWKREIGLSGLDASLLIRNLLKKELQIISELKSIVSKSKLSEKDVEELSEKVENSLTEKFDRSIE